MSFKKLLWIVLFTLIAAFAIWFITKAGIELYHYCQLNTQVPVTVESLSIEEFGSNSYGVIAHYHYTFNEKVYSGKGPIGSVHPNPWAATQAKKKFETQAWSVWINPDKPERSTLEKHFPLKRTLSAAVMLGLVLYFVSLGIYLRVKNG